MAIDFGQMRVINILSFTIPTSPKFARVSLSCHFAWKAAMGWHSSIGLEVAAEDDRLHEIRKAVLCTLQLTWQTQHCNAAVQQRSPPTANGVVRVSRQHSDVVHLTQRLRAGSLPSTEL